MDRPVTDERGTFFSPINSTGAGNSRYFFRSADINQLYVGFGSPAAGASGGYESASPPASTVPVVLTASGTGNVLNMNGLDARTGNIGGGYPTTTMTDIPQIADRSTSDSKMNGDIAEIVLYSAANSTALGIK